MTPVDKLVISTNVNLTLEEAQTIMRHHRVADIPIVGEDNALRYLVTRSDVIKLLRNSLASLDSRGRLLVGAAVGVKKEDMKRAESLVKCGADVLVVDIAHGHSELCMDFVKQLKSHPVTSNVDIIAGNIATGQAAHDLIEAGADGLKIGVGPGSICITRLVAGSGVPQFSAVR